MHLPYGWAYTAVSSMDKVSIGLDFLCVNECDSSLLLVGMCDKLMLYTFPLLVKTACLMGCTLECWCILNRTVKLAKLSFPNGVLFKLPFFFFYILRMKIGMHVFVGLSTTISLYLLYWEALSLKLIPNLHDRSSALAVLLNTPGLTWKANGVLV